MSHISGDSTAGTALMLDSVLSSSSDVHLDRPTFLLWAYQLKREHHYLLERIDKADANIKECVDANALNAATRDQVDILAKSVRESSSAIRQMGETIEGLRGQHDGFYNLINKVHEAQSMLYQRSSTHESMLKSLEESLRHCKSASDAQPRIGVLEARIRSLEEAMQAQICPHSYTPPLNHPCERNLNDPQNTMEIPRPQQKRLRTLSNATTVSESQADEPARRTAVQSISPSANTVVYRSERVRVPETGLSAGQESYAVTETQPIQNHVRARQTAPTQDSSASAVPQGHRNIVLRSSWIPLPSLPHAASDIESAECGRIPRQPIDADVQETLMLLRNYDPGMNRQEETPLPGTISPVTDQSHFDTFMTTQQAADRVPAVDQFTQPTGQIGPSESNRKRKRTLSSEVNPVTSRRRSERLLDRQSQVSEGNAQKSMARARPTRIATASGTKRYPAAPAPETLSQSQQNTMLATPVSRARKPLADVPASRLNVQKRKGDRKTKPDQLRNVRSPQSYPSAEGNTSKPKKQSLPTAKAAKSKSSNTRVGLR